MSTNAATVASYVSGPRRPGGPKTAFGVFAPTAELRETFEHAYAVGTIGRALAWHDYMKVVDPRFRAEIAPAMPYGLQRFLERGPIGTWRWEKEDG